MRVLDYVRIQFNPKRKKLFIVNIHSKKNHENSSILFGMINVEMSKTYGSPVRTWEHKQIASLQQISCLNKLFIYSNKLLN